VKVVKRGFTLIELLVVITIIGLLATIGIASFTRAQARGRDARRQSDLSALRSALELYYSERNNYPDKLPDLVPTYIKVLPEDPGGAGLDYKFTSSGQAYCLAAKLETLAAGETDSTCDSLPTGGYNYGVSNP
jgi:general secretion pathway protein G